MEIKEIKDRKTPRIFSITLDTDEIQYIKDGLKNDMEKIDKVCNSGTVIEILKDLLEIL